MPKDYYKTLGVDKSASKDDIKKAFRKLAHENHPDKTKNDPASSARFKEASEAYSVLSDDTKRKQYDQFGAAGVGAGGPGGPGGFNPNAGGFGGFGGFDFSQFTRDANNGGGFHFSQNGVEFDLGDIFGEFFGGGGRRRQRKGATINVDVNLSFKESIFGVEREITYERRDEKDKFVMEKLSVTIPPGIENGQGLRVSGKGEPAGGGGGDGVPGDLIVRVWVKNHPTIHKEGINLVSTLQVKLTKTLLGGTVELETLDGDFDLKIPTGSVHGDVLRVKGKGVPYESRGIMGSHDRRGDFLVIIHVIIPKKLSKNAERLVEELGREGI